LLLYMQELVRDKQLAADLWVASCAAVDWSDGSAGSQNKG
jgi:hypothetical protein